MRKQKRRCKARWITINKFYILTGILVIFFVLFISGIQNGSQLSEDIKAEKIDNEIMEVLQATPTSEAQQELSYYSDPNNRVYPFNTISADWGSEIYESGFRYYQIPEEYVADGGCFPEIVQVYLWSLCEDRGIDYYIMVALIESESQYKYNAKGDNGNSLGYMQIYKKWHKNRMEEENVDNLLNPYQNIRVGTNFFSEIQDKYLDSSGIHCVLMVYNMGEDGAKKCWSRGVYSTEYSRKILNRAQDIKQE